MTSDEIRKQPSRHRTTSPAASTRRIRVVVADSHPIDRKGMIGLLEEQRDFEVAGEAGTVAETIEQCEAQRPDVLILSLHVGLPGETPIPAIRARLSDLRILALSERGNASCLVLNPPGRRLLPAEENPRTCTTGNDCLQLAVAQGAVGTLRRDAEPEDLFRAVRAIAAGNAWYEPGTTSRFLNMTAGTADGLAHLLSPRELEVAALIGDGHSNKEIGEFLKISEPTVKKHVGRILEKLGLGDRLQAGLFVARNPLALRRA